MPPAFLFAEPLSCRPFWRVIWGDVETAGDDPFTECFATVSAILDVVDFIGKIGVTTVELTRERPTERHYPDERHEQNFARFQADP